MLNKTYSLEVLLSLRIADLEYMLAILMEDPIVHSYCTYAECKEQAIHKFPGQSVYDVCSLCEFHKLAGMEIDAQDNVQELAIPIENDVEIIISQDDNQEIIFETVQKYVIDSSCSQTPRLSGGRW